MKLIHLAERGWLPDSLIRLGMRQLCKQRLQELYAGGIEQASLRFNDELQSLRESPLAIHTEEANQQHYELPPEFFQLCLGKHLKYSACLFDRGDESLDQAEAKMLALYGQRAELADGQEILELGCGWGSLTLWMAAQFPNAQITAVSNSNPQREFIEQQCKARGLSNVKVITCDVNTLHLNQTFDRVVSIEMFEHLRNYQTLFANIATWLKADGKLFVHIFCHRQWMYPFETEGEDNWMGKYFFTGGLMPSINTFLHFADDLKIENRWCVSGTHYKKTAEAWLQNQDSKHEAVMAVLTQAYGPQEAKLWFQRWRMFWMACAELFAYDQGDEWVVGHFLFTK